MRVSTPESHALPAAERARIDARITEPRQVRATLDRVIGMSEGPASACAYRVAPAEAG